MSSYSSHIDFSKKLCKLQPFPVYSPRETPSWKNANRARSRRGAVDIRTEAAGSAGALHRRNARETSPPRPNARWMLETARSRASRTLATWTTAASPRAFAAARLANNKLDARRCWVPGPPPAAHRPRAGRRDRASGIQGRGRSGAHRRMDPPQVPQGAARRPVRQPERHGLGLQPHASRRVSHPGRFSARSNASRRTRTCWTVLSRRSRSRRTSNRHGARRRLQSHHAMSSERSPPASCSWPRWARRTCASACATPPGRRPWKTGSALCAARRTRNRPAGILRHPGRQPHPNPPDGWNSRGFTGGIPRIWPA